MMTNSTYAIGVDIGGTKIAFALVNSKGEAITRHRVSTAQHEGLDAVIQRIADGVKQLETHCDGTILGIGIGNPGIVDAEHGLVKNAVHLGWRDEPIQQLVYDSLDGKYPVYIENDVRALAMGEYTFGVAKGYKNFVYIALGTGLGDAAMVDGKLLIGAHFAPMELGHMATVPNGRKCICGRFGCLDMYLSGVGLTAGTKEHRDKYPDSPLAQIDDPSSYQVIEHMKQGDPLAEIVRQETVHWMKHVLMWTGGVLDTGLFVIGGGTGHAIMPLIMDDLKDYLKGHLVLPPEQVPVIKLSTVDDSAVGASCLVWQAQST